MHAAMLPSEMTLENLITMQAVAVSSAEGEMLPLLEPVSQYTVKREEKLGLNIFYSG
jgi:hypothetical protein